MRHGLLFGLGLCAFSLSAVARTGSQQARPVNVSSTTVDEVVQAVRADLQSSRKDVIAKSLTLTPDQEAKFWPLFEAYQKEQSAILDEQLAGVQRYIETADTLDDKGALSLIHAHLNRDARMVALREQWLGRFRNVLGAKLAVRMMQIDRRLSLSQQLRIVTKIPLVH
jgi:Spy/CpxP family protein refolding chaperone